MGECTASGDPRPAADFRWWVQNRAMGDVDMGAGSVLAWNGVLDERYGPQNGGCRDCRGLLSIDFSKGDPKLSRNPEYFALRHLSQFVRPGAKRVLNASSAGAPRHLVFRNPDGATTVLVENFGPETEFLIRAPSGRLFQVRAPEQSTLTLKIP